MRRKTRKSGRRRSYRRRQLGGEHETIDDFVFVNLLDTTPELRSEITEHIRICWPDSNEIEDAYEFVTAHDRRNKILIYKKELGVMVFSRIITLVPEDKAISIDLTCVSPTHRGKGHYKASLAAMRKKFSPDEFKYIQNRAEMETIGNITHDKRLEVFHKLGYRFSPQAEIGPGSYVNTQFWLKDGTIVQMLEYDESAAEPSYKVLTRYSGTKTIKLSDIENCVIPKTRRISFIFDDSSKNGKKINWQAGETWETTEEGIKIGETVYPWGKIRRHMYGPIGENRFNARTSEIAYCSLIMPF